jgi:hypothetical protein
MSIRAISVGAQTCQEIGKKSACLLVLWTKAHLGKKYLAKSKNNPAFFLE